MIAQSDQPPAIAPAPVPGAGTKTRFLLLKLSFALFFVVVAFRLVQVQILDAGRYQELGRKQYEQRFVLPAVRGNIYDRNGNVLVSNTMFVSFAADPKLAADEAPKIAATFAKVLGRPAAYYLEKLGGRGAFSSRRFVWMERSVRPETARRIEQARLPGIVMMNEPKRLYHYDQLAGTLIGFTNVDNEGISGLELTLDGDLKGTSGSVTLQRDGLGRTRPSADYPRIDPVSGHDITLTVDVEWQAVAEEELRRGLEQNGADAGMAVLMSPATGEILALAVVPGVNPNDPSLLNEAFSRNRVVTDIFEPGSVFKVVTAAAAFEHNVIRPDEKFYAEGGTMKVTIGRYVRLIKDTHEYEWLTFREAIEMSSNIVMAKASTKIGAQRLYTTARDFGFGVPTGVDMPGEVRGMLKRPQQWSGTTLQTLAYGYEVGATPLQILCAYGAVANGGVLMKPHVVSAIRSGDGTTIREERRSAIRRVVSERTAALLRDSFEGVVERGTAKDVAIPGVRIAGKTGTSRTVVEGKYADGSYTASFAGFFPADDPQVVGLVMMDNPRRRGYYGGITSGPVFRAIAERIINGSSRMSRTVASQRDPSRDKTVTAPDVRMMRVEFAKRMLASLGLTGRTYGAGPLVVRQTPDAGKPIEPGDAVTLVLGKATRPSGDGTIAVPDVRGMSIRRAMNRMAVDEFDVTIHGSGLVRSQSPLPGSKARAGTHVTLICEPKSLSQAELY